MMQTAHRGAIRKRVRVMRGSEQARTCDDSAQNMHFDCPRHLSPPCPPYLTSRKVQVTIGTNGSVTCTRLHGPKPEERKFFYDRGVLADMPACVMPGVRMTAVKRD